MSEKNGKPPKINVTKNYDLFRLSKNREVKPQEHRRLKASMEKYGFLDCFPVVCHRDKAGNLTIAEGQHRVHFAREFDLPVYWIEKDEESFSIPELNGTQVPWKPGDHAYVFAQEGNDEYREGLEFAESHGLPIGTAFALLAGVTAFKSIKDQFQSGGFKIKDRKWADDVAGIYGPITAMTSEIKRGNARFLEACMAVCSVRGFDSDRLIQCAQRCRDKLVAYATRDAYLGMLEEIYNYGRSKKVSLKFDAISAMNAKNPTRRNGHAE